MTQSQFSKTSWYGANNSTLPWKGVKEVPSCLVPSVIMSCRGIWRPEMLAQLWRLVTAAGPWRAAAVLGSGPLQDTLLVAGSRIGSCIPDPQELPLAKWSLLNGGYVRPASFSSSSCPPTTVLHRVKDLLLHPKLNGWKECLHCRLHVGFTGAS